MLLTLPCSSDNQVREVRRQLHKCKLNDHITVSFKSRNISSILNTGQKSICKCIYCVNCEGPGSCMSKNVVYRIQCKSCPSFYIGEITRTMKSRLREHCKISSSLVYLHLCQPSAIPDPNNIQWSIVHFGLRNTDVRRAVEFKEICSQRPDINVQHSNF